MRACVRVCVGSGLGVMMHLRLDHVLESDPSSHRLGSMDKTRVVRHGLADLNSLRRLADPYTSESEQLSGDQRDGSVVKSTFHLRGPEFTSSTHTEVLPFLKLQEIRLPLLVSGYPQASAHALTQISQLIRRQLIRSPKPCPFLGTH